jgi:predicted NUDIX family NTP pyrophosphohydrolase
VEAATRLDYDRSMSARAAFVLGLFLVLAAAVHGGLYSAGHDFVMNRFTGAWEFVPADDYDEGEDAKHVEHMRFRTLTSRGVAARVEGLQCRR